MLVSAAEEDRDRVPLAPKIDPYSATDENSKFLHAIADRPAVAKVAKTNPGDSLSDPNSSLFVPQPPEPPTERLDTVRTSIEADLLLNRHGRTVA